MEHFLKNLTAEAFNEKYPVGTRFKYFSVLGIPDSVEVTTRTPAWVLDHGAVVVSLTGRAGGFHIKHMKFVAFPEKELPRLTVFDIESLKALCVRVISLYPLKDDQIEGRAECPLCKGEGYTDAASLMTSKREAAIEIFGLKGDTSGLEAWLNTVTPELVIRLLGEINLDKGAK